VNYKIIRKDGMIRQVKDYGRLIRDKENGDVFYVFIVDVTDEKGEVI